MLSRADQRRLDEIARHLRDTDPEFAMAMGGPARPRAYRMLLTVSVVLWTLPVALTALGGWLLGAITAVVLTAAGVALLLCRRW
ncbi:DUF3040 domain-containing protein [Rhizomonospora bruguierae]|uniref:DUF3040 domain-containing protein n=1 Tax=Rhizomonospora bruguierae TaxID=1581705 RepID=UPI001BCEE42C|nr:DUF3040 domain-containing protein [Micromonospora sp. NBRC 107566]